MWLIFQDHKSIVGFKKQENEILKFTSLLHLLQLSIFPMIQGRRFCVYNIFFVIIIFNYSKVFIKHKKTGHYKEGLERNPFAKVIV